MLETHDSDFTQFIEFGNIFDRPTREYLVQYLKNKIQPEKQKLQFLSDNSVDFQYLQTALDKIFENDKLLKVGKENTVLGGEIIKDTLKWLKQAHQRNKAENPYEEERKELDRWFGKPAFLWVRTWYILTNYLREIYTREEIDTLFYQQKFEEITRPIDAKALENKQKDYSKQLAELDILIEDLLNRWQSLLTAKTLQFELENIDKQREEFCALLYAKIEEFVKLLSILTPFQNEIGRFWDMSRGLWKTTHFDVLEKYAVLLDKEQSIQELADLLGRMRETEMEIEEEVYEQVISKRTWVEDYHLKDEIGGVYESDNLNYVLPSEVSLLGFAETESIFLKKFADKQLLSFRHQGKVLVQSDNINYFSQQRLKRKEKGPFIICIDTSGSMEGLPEQIAKVVCFAILKMASREQRKCFLISFSIGIQTVNLTDLANSMDEVVKFLAMSFHGGTDVTPAMIATVNMLTTNDYKEADVLMISDFVMFEIREEVLKKIRYEQTKGTKFHSLTISQMPNPEIIHQFDNQWIYRPESREVVKQVVKDLYQTLTPTKSF